MFEGFGMGELVLPIYWKKPLWRSEPIQFIGRKGG
jgi:hypothetical protein